MMSFRVWSVCRNGIFKRNINQSLVVNRNYQNETNYSKEEELEDNYKRDQSKGPIIKLYAEHIPTTITQKILLSLGSGITAITDPYRHDMVAVFGETTGHLALRNIYENMMKDSEGRKILEDKPRINSKTIDIEKLSTFPDGSFGREYYNFLTNNKVTPDSRRSVKFVDEVNLAYVMQRYREAHDLVHTLLGMPTNMLGEVVVKWVEAIQTDLPMCWLGGLFGAVRLAPKQRKNYVNTYLPWALRCGHECKPLMNVYYEKRFEQDLEDLRKELNIPAIPKVS